MRRAAAMVLDSCTRRSLRATFFPCCSCAPAQAAQFQFLQAPFTRCTTTIRGSHIYICGHSQYMRRTRAIWAWWHGHPCTQKQTPTAAASTLPAGAQARLACAMLGLCWVQGSNQPTGWDRCTITVIASKADIGRCVAQSLDAYPCNTRQHNWITGAPARVTKHGASTHQHTW